MTSYSSGDRARSPFIQSVGGISPRVTASFSRPADNTAYQAGDIIANSGTAASVVPMSFLDAAPMNGSGRLLGVRAVVAPASGNLVIANLAFDLLVFRPSTDIPFAAGSFPADNAAMSISAAAMRQLVGVFSFVASDWRSPAGSVSAAGVAGYQAVSLRNNSRQFAPFSLDGLGATHLVGVLQAQAAWTPTGVANQFDFALDIEGN